MDPLDSSTHPVRPPCEAERSRQVLVQILGLFSGLMQADAYAGFNHLYEIDRKLAPIIEAACWAHTRRKFFELARINKAPIAAEAVREINGLTALQRVSVRSERSQPLIAELENLHADRYRRAQRRRPASLAR